METKFIIDNIKKKNRVKVNDNKKLEFTIYNKIKRFVDITLALMGIVLLSPVLIIIAVFIKLESKGPIIFKQERAGIDSKIFNIYKFRSMRVDAPNMATNDFVDSSRFITKVGKFIRQTSIDELPQLFNILKGDMSIVGPRPVILEEKELINLRKIYNVDSVLPGITGLAQINGRDNIGIDEKVKYDYEYIMNRSIRLDLKILAITISKVLKKSDIKE